VFDVVHTLLSLSCHVRLINLVERILPAYINVAAHAYAWKAIIFCSDLGWVANQRCRCSGSHTPPWAVIVTERNLTILGHMFRSESDLKVHVQNLEFLPLKRVAPEAGCFGCNYDA